MVSYMTVIAIVYDNWVHADKVEKSCHNRLHRTGEVVMVLL